MSPDHCTRPSRRPPDSEPCPTLHAACTPAERARFVFFPTGRLFPYRWCGTLDVTDAAEHGERDGQHGCDEAQGRAHPPADRGAGGERDERARLFRDLDGRPRARDRPGKWSLYNHFDSKETFALAAFEYSVALVGRRFDEALAGRERAIDRLRAIVGVFRSLADAPPLPGGDSVLNMAIESDDTYPALLERAQAAMTIWQKLIGKAAKEGVARGELRPDIDLQELASVITSTLEGAVMMSKLFRDPIHMRWAVDHLMACLDTLVSSSATLHTGFHSADC